jgi:sec-independent protein translocase protein TatA
MKTLFLFISGPEIIVVLLIIVLVFGTDKIPELARGLGKGIRQVKDATNDIKREINDSAKNQGIDTSVAKDIQKEVSGIKDNLDDFTGPIKRNM